MEFSQAALKAGAKCNPFISLLSSLVVFCMLHLSTPFFAPYVVLSCNQELDPTVHHIGVSRTLFFSDVTLIFICL